MNFTWWVNRKDSNGNNLFAGGFLGLDNIGVFDRSHGVPYGSELEQADGTAWMAFYCTTMLAIAIELAEEDTAYEELASKFFDHYVSICLAMNGHGRYEGLWDEDTGFYYDWITEGGKRRPLSVRSLVGLLPMIAVLHLDLDQTKLLTKFSSRMEWFLRYKPHLAEIVQLTSTDGKKRLVSCCPKDRLLKLLSYLFDEDEFLSEYGIRSLSKYHEDSPFTTNIGGANHSIAFNPGESDSPMFGGNSNWRGPIWFPTNHLLIESLRTYHSFYGDELKVEFPTGSGNKITLQEAAEEISHRLLRIFEKDSEGKRPLFANCPVHHPNTGDNERMLFYEYFQSETGEGLGASHQTGWSSLVGKLLLENHRKASDPNR